MKIAFLGLGKMGKAIAGRLLASGHAVTRWTIAEIASMPQDIGTRASFSNPTGMSRQETIAHGMTQKPVIGTATALAITE